MEIKKSYELYQVGTKIILKKMTAPDYEMKVICIADKMLDEKDNKKLPDNLDSHPFFVLSKGTSFVLCWDKQNNLQIVNLCTDFHILSGSLLLQKENCWYWWTASSNENQLQALGTDLQLFKKAFILPDKSNYLLMYFESNESLKCKRCLSYEVLNSDLHTNSFLNEELFPDVLKIITAEEGTLYISIRKKKGPSFNHMYGTTKGDDNYEFEFAKEPATKLIEFTKFANQTCQLLLDEGFTIALTTFTDIKFDYAKMQEMMKKDVKASIYAPLTQALNNDVSIEVNLSRLYHKRGKAYMVKCPELGYYKEVDEIGLEKTSAEHALWIIADNIKDKIYCKSGNALTSDTLKLATRIS